MKSNPAVPGGSLESKPTWLNTYGCSTTSAFLLSTVDWESCTMKRQTKREF
jgi:hypothetical protein